MKRILLLNVYLLFVIPLYSQNTSITYLYDALNRLLHVEYSNGTVIDYTYDANGNRMNHVVTPASSVAIKDLCASVDDETILLEWTALEDATAYNIYRGTSYDFIPDLENGSNRIAENITDEDQGTEGVQWTDTGSGADIVGDPNTNYYYRVTGVIAGQSYQSPPSNVAGEFDIKLFTTNSTDINELVVAFNTKNSRAPISTAEELAQAIPYCSDVYYWDAPGQGTVGHPKGVPFNNFPVHPGYPYIVNVTKDTIWSVAGAFIDTSFHLITTSSTDINRIGVPLPKGSITNAEELGIDIPNCTDVYYWDASGQGTIGHPIGVHFNNFPVYQGFPYYVNVTEETTWPSDGESVLLARSKTQEKPNYYLKSGLVSGGVPHTVYGKLSLSEDFELDSSQFKIRSWINGRTEDVLTQESSGVNCDGEYWWISISKFTANWKVGETLHIKITNEKLGLGGETEVILTDAGSDDGGELLLTKAVIDDDLGLIGVPEEFILYPNYPNPFNPETKIIYGLPNKEYVKIQIFDITGRLVNTLVSEQQVAGYHQVRWNGQDAYETLVSSGIYWCRISAGDFNKTMKLVFMK